MRAVRPTVGAEIYEREGSGRVRGAFNFKPPRSFILTILEGKFILLAPAYSPIYLIYIEFLLRNVVSSIGGLLDRKTHPKHELSDRIQGRHTSILDPVHKERGGIDHRQPVQSAFVPALPSREPALSDRHQPGLIFRSNSFHRSLL